MWETPFDPSMLNGSGVVIHCPYEPDADTLMDILAEHGVKWCDGTTPASAKNSCWNMSKENMVYYIDRRKSMSYGDKSAFSEYGYTKCTFYGEPEPEFEPADDNELLAFLGL